jgi:hypothetical protein
MEVPGGKLLTVLTVSFFDLSRAKVVVTWNSKVPLLKSRVQLLYRSSNQ